MQVGKISICHAGRQCFQIDIDNILIQEIKNFVNADICIHHKTQFICEYS